MRSIGITSSDGFRSDARTLAREGLSPVDASPEPPDIGAHISTRRRRCDPIVIRQDGTLSMPHRALLVSVEEPISTSNRPPEVRCGRRVELILRERCPFTTGAPSLILSSSDRPASQASRDRSRRELPTRQRSLLPAEQQ